MEATNFKFTEKMSAFIELMNYACMQKGLLTSAVYNKLEHQFDKDQPTKWYIPLFFFGNNQVPEPNWNSSRIINSARGKVYLELTEDTVTSAYQVLAHMFDDKELADLTSAPLGVQKHYAMYTELYDKAKKQNDQKLAGVLLALGFLSDMDMSWRIAVIPNDIFKSISESGVEQIYYGTRVLLVNDERVLEASDDTPSIINGNITRASLIDITLVLNEPNGAIVDSMITPEKVIEVETIDDIPILTVRPLSSAIN